MPLNESDVVLGRYRIEARLGEGGMGAVYRAFDTLHDRPCALKEFRLGDLPTEDETHVAGAAAVRGGRKTPQVTREKAVEQFRREAKLLATLDHPNLPKVTDYFGVGDDYFLLMTLIEGDDLATVLEQAGGRPLPEAQVLGWIDQVLDALAYCHSQGVIHRDVKPANMVLTPEGKVYLVDFGIAKPDDPSGKTTIGARATTPGYSPPEQYGGEAHTDARSDIYALGATLYALLTGQDPVDAIDRLRGRELPRPRSLAPAISPALDAAIVRAMAIRPEDRFQDVPSLQAALRKAAQAPGPADEGARAAVPPPAEKRRVATTPVQRPTKSGAGPRRWWPLAAGAIAVAGLAVALVAWLRLHPTPTTTPLRSTPPVSPVPRKTWALTLAPDVTMESVRVPEGEFLMGGTDEETIAISGPQHSVRLGDYWIGRDDVTVAQFRAFVLATAYQTTAEKEGSGRVPTGDPRSAWVSLSGADWQHPLGPARGPARDDQGVTQVSWDDAVAFCRWASETTGVALRLPTEAQWEKAARVSAGEVHIPTIWNWTSSLHKPYPYSADDGREDPTTHAERVIRGGDVDNLAGRKPCPPQNRDSLMGFRVCVSPS